MYIVFWKEDGGGSPVISDKLTPQQAGELTTLLQEFSDVLRNEPRSLNTVYIDTDTDTDTAHPIRIPPHAYRDTVKSEL